MTRPPDMERANPHPNQELVDLLRQGRHAAALTLVDQGCIEETLDASLTDEEGRTMLHFLAGGKERTDHSDSFAAYGMPQVRILARIIVDAVKCGNDIEARDRYGNTPLIAACSRGDDIAAFALLRCGADHTPCNEDGVNPRDAATAAGHRDLADLMDIVDATRNNDSDDRIRSLRKAQRERRHGGPAATEPKAKPTPKPGLDPAA